MIRIGAIGVGGIGGHHINIASKCNDVIKLVAVCDINEDIAKKVAEQYHVEYHTGYKEICDRGDIDAVIIALPHYLYGEVVTYALEKGLHVFKEKPLAKTLADAEAIIKAAQKTKKQVFVAGQNKFSNVFIKGKEIVDSGALGDIFLTRGAIIYRWGGAIENRWSWRGKEELSGGVAIIDAGWHILDMVHWYRGMPSAVYAVTGKMKGAPGTDYDVDDKAVLILEYPDGGIGSIVSCYITLPSEMRVTLHGVKGCIDIYNGNLSFMIQDKVQDVSVPSEEIDPITAQMRHFAEIIISNKDSEIAGLERAYQVMRIIDAAYKSVREMRKVEI